MAGRSAGSVRQPARPGQFEPKAGVWAQSARSDAARLMQRQGDAEPGEAVMTMAREHRRLRSGNVIWCEVCGTYSEFRGRGMARVCPGKPADFGGDGRAQQLRRLRSEIHPTTGVKLPPAVPERLWGVDSPADGPGGDGADDTDIDHLAKSHIGRMRLRIRARDARTHASDWLIRRAERIEEAIGLHSEGLPKHDGPSAAETSVESLVRALVDAANGVDGYGQQLGSWHADCALNVPPLPVLFGADMKTWRSNLPVPPIYPPGYSGVQPAEWHAMDQSDLDAWIASGRPEVVVQRLPVPGIVSHPWVTFTGHYHHHESGQACSCDPAND